jgi:copper(I)-binding protein
MEEGGIEIGHRQKGQGEVQMKEIANVRVEIQGSMVIKTGSYAVMSEIPRLRDGRAVGL